MAILLAITAAAAIALAAYSYGQARSLREHLTIAHQVMRRAQDRAETLQDRLQEAYQQLASMRREGFVAAPRRPEPPPADPIPDDIEKALQSYPPELQGPTRQWIRERRRTGADWEVIKQRIIGPGYQAS